MSQRALLGGILLGMAGGLGVNFWGGGARWAAVLTDYVAAPLGQIFLRLLFMLVIPLLFSALVLGICDLDLKHLGRLGARLLGYTVVVSAIAVAIGVVLVNVIGPGRGLSVAAIDLSGAATAIKAAAPPKDTSALGLLVALFPDNVFKAMATGDMLALIAFSLIFGVGLATTHTDGARSLRGAIQGLFDVSMQIIGGVLKLAPIGVGALLFTATARLGLDLLRQLALYVAVVLLGLGLHMFVVYSASVKLFGNMSPLRFFSGVRLAAATAFSTASSNATLPTALKVADESLGLPRHVSRFVLTAGASMNQNGTALFEGVTVLFLAQVYGIELGLPQQLLVVVVCILAGIGTAGVPAGSLPVIAMILGMVGVPPEGIGLILGVDRFLDMCRTTLNVVGDLAAAVYVSRGESESGA